MAIDEIPPARGNLHVADVLALRRCGELFVLEHLQIDQLGKHKQEPDRRDARNDQNPGIGAQSERPPQRVSGITSPLRSDHQIHCQLFASPLSPPVLN